MVVVDAETTVTVVVWDMSSGQHARRDFDVSGYFQINNVFEAVGLENLETTDAAVQILWDNPGLGTRWLFTASVNDNVTSDPTYIGEGPWFVFPND